MENSPGSSSNSGAHVAQKCGRNCEVDERARTRVREREEENLGNSEGGEKKGANVFITPGHLSFVRVRAVEDLFPRGGGGEEESLFSSVSRAADKRETTLIESSGKRGLRRDFPNYIYRLSRALGYIGLLYDGTRCSCQRSREIEQVIHLALMQHHVDESRYRTNSRGILKN